MYVTTDNSNNVIGYYTLSSAHTDASHFPNHMVKHISYRNIPVVLLGRFAVDKRYQGKGLGARLLIRAIHHILKSPVASMAVMVEAKDEAAKNFYTKYGFITCPGTTNKLLLHIRTMKDLLEKMEYYKAMPLVLCETQEIFAF